MRSLLVLIPIALFPCLLSSQSAENRPKLVVGIVVDQMRNDYLQRYSDLYSDDGFKKLMSEGFYAANHHFSYMPTTTAPGHASVYTGTTPAVHGIAGNDWYDPIKKKEFYCVQDKSVKTIGLDNKSGQMSPRNLRTTTITDELKVYWNNRSKVIGVSLKDRGSILPAGHLADAAYWYDDQTFISSSFYMDELPKWVRKFNEDKKVDEYLSLGWDLLHEREKYVASLPDDNPYESIHAGESAPTLPKDLEALAEQNGKDKILKQSPWGNRLVMEFGKRAVLEEGLGKDDITDFLALSFSTPDHMGHAYGPRALEIQDMYLRLDMEIAGLLEFLDKEVGEGQYLVMLTADHGAAEVPQFSIDSELPGGYFDTKSGREIIAEALLKIDSVGSDMIEKIEGNHVYFNREVLEEVDVELDDLAEYLSEVIADLPGVYSAYPTTEVRLSGSEEFPLRALQRGIHPTLSGDVVFVLESGWITYGPTGTTHGSPWNYDSHIPLLIYGGGISSQTIYRETNIRDIAPTLCILMGIPFPSGLTGQPITEVLIK